MAERRLRFVQRRKAVGLSQQALADRLQIDTRTVRHWEAGTHPPLPHVRPALAQALQVSIEELDYLITNSSESVARPHRTGLPYSEFEQLHSKLAAQLDRTTTHQPSGQSASTKPIELPDGTPIPIGIDQLGHELDTLLLAPLTQWAALDNWSGPGRLRDLATGHFGVVETFLDDARGTDFERLAYIAARHAEFCGWLAQDSGDHAGAMRWSDAALESARLIEDYELESYILMRKSNIASDQHRTDLSIALADAAWHSSRPLSGPLRALALRQQAHALTAAQDATAALRSIDRARQQLVGPVADSDLAGYCTHAYLDMEAAAVLIDLGQAGDAIPILEQGLRSWAPEYRRDLGLCLARLALAYARIREPETAASVAAQSAPIAHATGSQRTVGVLRQVTGILEMLNQHEQARSITDALTQSPDRP